MPDFIPACWRTCFQRKTINSPGCGVGRGFFFLLYLFLKGSEIARNGSQCNGFLSQHICRGRMSSNVSS